MRSPSRSPADDRTTDGSGLSLRLADLGLEVRCAEPRWRALAAARYGAFAAAGSPRLRLEYVVTDARPVAAEAIAAARRREPQAERRGSALSLVGEGFTAALDLDRGDGEVRGPLATFPLDVVLRAVLPELLEDGVLLHAAALAEGDRGYVLAGPPGAGKTTLAGLFPARALSEELVAVRLAGDGARVHGLPFWNGRQRAAPLAGIFLLRHGDADRATPLPEATALRRLARDTVWPLADSPATRATFATLAELVERVPPCELAFRPTPAVWATLTGAPGT